MTEWPLVAVRFALYLALATLFGLAAFALYALRRDERCEAIDMRPWLGALAILGVLLSVGWLVLITASMAGTGPWPVDRSAVEALLGGSAIGTSWIVRIAALVVAAVAAVGAGRRTGPLAVVTVSSATALAALAWAGHGAAGEGTTGWWQLAADVVHLLASGAWIGAIFGLVLLVARPLRRIDAAHLQMTYRALHEFGPTGTIIVAAIVATGLVNGWVLVGVEDIGSIGTRLYGRLLIAKLVLFVAMLALAGLNRFRLTPAFAQAMARGDHRGDYRGALHALRRSLAVEASCVVTILGLVAWLGTLDPRG